MSVVLRAFVVAVTKLGTYWTCYVWLPKFMLHRFHEPIGRSTLWILTAQAGQFAGMMLFGQISDRIGRRITFSMYSALTAVALGVLAFQWPWLLQHRGYFWLTMASFGLGSGCTAGFGALLGELFPTEVRNFAMGLTYNSARGVQFFGPAVVAYFASRWDVTGALCVPLVLAVITGLWVWTLPETFRRNLAEVDIHH